MPKGFSDKEKKILQKSLIDNGRILYSTYGLKKTSIEDITKLVGIAKGSFYNFFNSKEELYFDILELEEEIIKEQLLFELAPLENKPKEYIKKLLECSVKLMESRPLITQLYQENIMEMLVRKLPEERIESHINKDNTFLSPIIQRWKSEGILREVETETILGLIRSIFMLSFHKEEIGETVYESVITLLIDLISKGLVIKEERS